MATNTNTERLNRIEEKIDKLSDAMITLARAEEKLVAIERNNQNTTERLNRLSQKMDELQHQVDTQTSTVNAFQKLFWIAIVAAAGAIASHYI